MDRLQASDKAQDGYVYVKCKITPSLTLVGVDVGVLVGVLVGFVVGELEGLEEGDELGDFEGQIEGPTLRLVD